MAVSKRLWNFFCGYLIIRIKGDDGYPFFSLLYQEGIKVFRLFEDDDSYIFSISLKDFGRLKDLARSMGFSLTVVKEVGLPFFYRYAKDHSFLLVGFLVVLLFIYTLSSFIWFIEIRGQFFLPERDIFLLLANEGLLPGVYRKSLDLERIEKNILKEEDRIGWIHIQLIGSMALVRILEKTLPPEPKEGYLYSKRDAIITKVILLKGEALVQEGETVGRGQLLITGEEAQAIVEGRTWYQASGFALKKERIELETKKRSSSYSLSFPLGFNFHVKGPKDAPFPEYQLEKTSYLLYPGRNLYLPIELIRKDFLSQFVLYSIRTTSMAVSLAQEEALRKILEELEDGARIINAKMKSQEEEEGVLVYVELEVIENILVRGGFVDDSK